MSVVADGNDSVEGPETGDTSSIALDDLLKAEHAGWRSLCEGRGAEFYGDLMTESGVMVLVNGMVLDRDDVKQTLKDGPSWDSYEIVAPRLVELGGEAASLVYRATARRGDEDPFVAWMTSTYLFQQGRLRLAVYQQTAVPGE